MMVEAGIEMKIFEANISYQLPNKPHNKVSNELLAEISKKGEDAAENYVTVY